MPRVVVETMEDRILHSADAWGLAGPDAPAGAALVQRVEAPASLAHSAAQQTEQQATRHEIAFVDAGLPGLDRLLAALAPTDGRTLEVVLIAPDEDGFARISATLDGRQDIAAVHLVSHGSDGAVQLGRAVLDSNSLLRQAGPVAEWGQALATDADWLIYGCDVAATERGLALLHDLAALTGADVAASDDRTGSALLGADWQLEQRVGVVETVALAPAATPGAADWQGVLANEAQANATTLDSQGLAALNRGSNQAVAVAADGSYVLVWTSQNQDGSGAGVYARRFAVDGTPLTGDILVPSSTTGNQTHANVASDPAGNFVVTWYDDSNGTDGDVMFRRFAADGTAQGAAQVATAFTTGAQVNPTIAHDPSNGGFVIGWQGVGAGDTLGVWMRRFDAAGNARDTNDILVRQVSASSLGLNLLLISLSVNNTDAPRNPAVAVDASGRVVVAYDLSQTVYFQRFDANGSAQGSAVAVDPTGSGKNFAPSIAMDGSGRFVVLYRETNIIPGVWGRGFKADGSQWIGSFNVASGDADSADIAMAADGRFLVTYQKTGSAGIDVYARHYTATGTAAGAAFILNATTAGDQVRPSVALVNPYQYAVAWSGAVPGDADGVALRTVENTAPVIGSNGGGATATVTVPEGSTAVTTVQATDTDLPAQALSYAIAGGADAARFTINASTGALAFATAPDHEAPADAGADNVYDVVVQASDGLDTDTQAIAVTVQQVYAAPVTAADRYTVHQNQPFSASVASGWYDPAWTTRQRISLNNSTGPALTDTAVLVTLDASTVDYARMQGGGQDLRFIDADGQRLAHEVETWNLGGISRVWVRVPAVDAASSADGFWLYYGNPDAADAASPAEVWPGARAVVHMGSTLADASASANPVTQSATTVASGQVGQARQFNGSTSTVSLGSAAALDDLFATGGTVSAWIYPTGWGEGGYGRIAAKASTVNAAEGWALQLDQARQSLLFEFGFTGQTGEWVAPTGAIALNRWQQVTLVYDASSPSNTPTLYVDGVALTMTRTSEPTGNARSDAALPLTLGNHSLATDRTFAGRIDEFRAYATPRSAAQVQADLRSATGVLATPGPVQTAAPGVLNNDTSPDGVALAARLATGPAHAASFTLRADGSFDYMPAVNFTGTDSFTYIASAGSTDAAPTTVTISVAPANTAPVITSDGGGPAATLSVAENTTTVTTVQATDPEVPVQTLSYAIVGGDDAARFTIDAATGVLRFATAPDFEAPDDVDANNVYQVSVAASDGLDTTVQTLTVNVTDRAITTVAVTGAATTRSGEAYTLSLSADEDATAWTVNWGDGTVLTYAGNPGTVSHVYAQAGFSHAILAAATDGQGTVHPHELVVPTYSGGNNVMRFAPVSGDHLQTFGANGSQTYPMHALVGPDGRLYVSEEGSSTVRRYDAATGALVDTFVPAGRGGLQQAAGMAFGPDGRLYVASYGSNQVLRFDGTSGAFIDAFVPSVNRPFGLGFGPDGRLYVALHQDGAVARYDAVTGGLVDMVVPAGSNGLSTPGHLLFDDGGRLYVNSAGTDEVQRYDTATGAYLGAFVGAGSGGLDRPGGMVFGPDGALYVASFGSNAVLRYDGDSGAYLGAYVAAGTGGLVGPSSLAFLPQQQVAVLNGSPQIGSNGGGDTATATVAENTTAVTTVTAADPDAGTSLVYAIAGGADAARFTIDAATGVLRFATAPDFENPADANRDNVYELTVRASDGAGASDTQALSVTVQDVGGTITVTTTADTRDGVTSSVEALVSNPGADGLISLREAITAANATPGLQRIEFAIAGAGAQTIVLASALPKVTDAVVIDGSTQPGSSANTLEEGSNAVIGIGLRAPTGGGIQALVLDTGSSGSTVRGLAIGGFTGLADGVAALELRSNDNLIAGNFIGFAPDGTTARGNSSGIALTGGASNNLIGGTRPADRNLVSASTYASIAIQGNGTELNRVLGNELGGDASGGVVAGSSSTFGVVVWGGASYNQVGSTAVGGGNRIQGHRDGIVVDNNGSVANTLRGNAIFGNREQGIDLANDGITANDAGDGDNGPNNRQNHPVLNNAVVTASTLTVSGTFDSLASSTFVLDFYANPVAEPGGSGEGALYVGSGTVTTGTSGLISFTASLADFTLPAGYTITATATSPGGNTSEFSPERVLRSTNQTPVIGSSGGAATAAAAVAEGSTAVATVAATDADGDPVRYEITGGADAALFTLDAQTGALAFAAAPDREAPADANGDNVYEVTVAATDGLASDTQALTVTVGNVNEAPQRSGSLANATATQDQAWTWAVPAGHLTDPDAGDTLTWTARRTDGSALPAWLAVDAATGRLSGTPGNGDVGQLGIRLTATDAGGLAASTDLLVDVLNVNDAPRITSDGGGTQASRGVAEGQTAVTTVTAVDVDLAAPALVYAITGGADAARFTIDASTGVLRFAAAPDFEAPADANADNIYEVQVAASDGSASGTQLLRVTVGDAAEPPVIVSDGGGASAALTVAENGTAVTTVQATDPDAGGTLAYAITGGADAARFTIDAASGVLRFATAPDVEAPADAGGDNVYDLVVSASDGTLADSQALRITVTPVNEAPRLARPLVDWLAPQGQPFSATVPADSFSDPDAGDALTWQATLASGTPLPAWLRFDPLTRQLSGTPGQAEVGTLLLRITATDGQGLSASDEAVLTVADVNDPPAITSDGGGATAAVTVAENTPGVTTVQGVDIDPGTTLGYAITGGADAARFTIDAGTGVLRFATAPDFETPADANADNTYEVQVAASDGSASATQTLRVTVSDAAEPPRLATPLADQTATQDQAFAFTVPATAFVEADAGDALAFQASLDSGAPLPGWLRFDPATRRFSGTPGQADVGTLTVRVSATDRSGQAVQDSFVLTVQDADDPPVIVSDGGGASAALTVAENGSLVTTVQATDLDPGTTLTYAIAGGADAARFTIDPATGVLRFAAAPDAEAPADAGADGVYEVVVRAFDGVNADHQAISVTVTPASDEPPVIVSDGGGTTATLAVAEGATAVTTVVATDADRPAETLRYAVTGGADAALFRIDARSGVLQFVAAPDFEAPADADRDGRYALTVAADDGVTRTEQRLEVLVRNVNEAPRGTEAWLAAPADGRRTLGRADFGFTDAPGEADRFTAVRVALPDAGQLWLDGVALRAATEVGVDRLDAGALVWTAPADHRSRTEATLRFQLRDDGGTAAGGQDLDPTPRLLHLTLDSVNSAPLARDDTAATLPALRGPADQVLRIDAATLLANDGDADGDALGLLAVAEARGGLAALEGGQVVFTPAAGASGEAGFRYTAGDGHGGQASAWVTLDLVAAPAPAPAPEPDPEPTPTPAPALASAPAPAAPADTPAPTVSDALRTAASTNSRGTAPAPAAAAAPVRSDEAAALPAAMVNALPGLQTSAMPGATVTGVPAAPALGRREDGEFKVALPGTAPAFSMPLLLAAAEPVPLAGLDTLANLRLETLRASGSLAQGFDQVREQLAAPQQEAARTVAVSSSVAVGTGLSIGYVVWLLRSGVLLGSVLSALPAWQLLDPLPVLARSGLGRGDGTGDGDDPPADDVERLFEGDGNAAAPGTTTARANTGNPPAGAAAGNALAGAAPANPAGWPPADGTALPLSADLPRGPR